MGDRNLSGVELEFTQWMKAHLGYQASHSGVSLGKGTDSSMPSVRGERCDFAWHRLRSFAFYAFAAAIVSRNVIAVPEGEIPWVANLLGGLAVASYVIAYFGKVRTRRYAWVECKDIDRPVSREDISTVNETVQRVRTSKTARWKPAQVMVVAGMNGFENEALEFAEATSIECFERAQSGFRRTTSVG